MINPDRLTDVTLLKRHVLKRCVYGVDLNPMAVELAKLSLWLDCFTMGAPLSFLDHHLRCGNSLIGAMAQDVEESLGENGQMTLLTGPFTGLLQAAEIMRGVSQINDITVGEVRQSSNMFKAFDEAAKPFKKLLDIYLAKEFGVERTGEYLDLHSQENAISMIKGNMEIPEIYKPLFFKTQKLYEKTKFFHWDLEFPEVFINLQISKWKPDGGFDAIMGNPPYIPTEQISKNEGLYYKEHFPISSGKYDLSVVFLTRSSELLRIFRRFGMIIPTTWQTGSNYETFREDYIVKGEFGPINITNLPFDIFEEAYIDTCIAIFCKPKKEIFNIYSFPKKGEVDFNILSKTNFEEILISDLHNDKSHRIFSSQSTYDFLNKFKNTFCIYVGDITDSCQGPVESFYEYSNEKVSENYVLYRNCEIDRYKLIIQEEKFINFGKNNPLLSYYTKPRILIRRIISRSDRLMAVTAKGTFVVKKDVNPFLLTDNNYSEKYILANINSKLHSFLYLESSTSAGKDDFRQTTLSSINSLPIKRIDFSLIQNIRCFFVNKLNNWFEVDNQSLLLDSIEDLLHLKFPNNEQTSSDIKQIKNIQIILLLFMIFSFS